MKVSRSSRSGLFTPMSLAAAEQGDCEVAGELVAIVAPLQDPAQRVVTRRAAVRATAVAVLGVCMIVAIVQAGASSQASHRHRGVDSSDKLLDLAAKKPFSVAPRAFQSKVLDRLWEVERILVDAEVCPASTPSVRDLRQQPWPKLYAGTAPKISKIMYINLQWDEGRRQFMESQLQTLHNSVMAERGEELQWERIAATGKQEIEHGSDLAWWRNKGFSQARSPDVRGDWATAACAYSHYSAMSKIPEADDSDLVMITEDDVDISPNFLEEWDHIWPFVPHDWDVLRVGWFSDHQNCSEVVNHYVDRAGWMDPKNGECAYCGAQAYIVNPRSKERVLKRFEKSKMTHADELLGAPTPQLEDPAHVPEIKAYVVLPMFANIAFNGDGSQKFGSDRIDGRAAAQ